MSKCLNKVTLIGHLGADPETRYMPSGKAVSNIRIATTERWTDKSTNEKVEQTEWHRIVLFDRLGEIAAEYLHKGSQCYVEGQLRTRKWQDKEGVDQYTTEIVARELILLSKAEGGSEQPQQRPTRTDARRPAAKSPPPRSAKAQPARRAAPPPEDDGQFDDDIPM